MRIQALIAVILAHLVGVSCISTSVKYYSSPEEATVAIIESIDAGDDGEASRAFDSFARGSIQRDRVFAELYGTAEQRYDAGDTAGAAEVWEFVTMKYPGAVNARESLVIARFVERAERGSATEEGTRALGEAVAGYRGVATDPSAWVDLASVQHSIDAGDLATARADFIRFVDGWDRQPAALMPWVEDLGRYLETQESPTR